MNMPVRRNTIAFLTARCGELEVQLATSRNECAQLRDLNAQWALQAKVDANKITRLKAQLGGIRYRDPDRPISPARVLMDTSREYSIRHGVSTRVVDGRIQAYDAENRTWNVVETTD